jgi:hypothetical protein
MRIDQGGRAMASFAEIFGIRSGNTLKEAGSHNGNYDDDWKHEEYDAQGNLVARYESWDYMRPREPHSAGWRKYDPAGALVEEHKELPL